MQPQQPPPPFGQQPQPSPWGVGGYDGGYGQAQAQQGSYPVHPFPYGQQVRFWCKEERLV